MKKKVCFAVFIFSCLFLLRFWQINLSRFTKVFDPDYFSKLYSQSQYVLGPKSVGGIGDDGLYAFAGYYYFFQGGDVSAVNFEHPPLGKYLIGLSVFLFRNENVINILYFLLLLYFTYKIAGLFMDKYLSLLPISLLTLDPLFLDHTIRSQLDLPSSLAFTAAVFFFLKSFKKPVNFYFCQLFVGFAFAIRFFPFLIILEFMMLLIVLLKNKKNLLHFFVSIFIVPLIYLISHISFFIYHPGIAEFLRHKKWMLSWYRGTPVIPGNFIRNIFTGRLIDTQGLLIINKEWSPLQPLVLVLASIYSPSLTLYLITFLYFIYVVVLTDGVAKFLMPVMPLLAVLAIKNIIRIYSIIQPWMRLKLLPLKAR